MSLSSVTALDDMFYEMQLPSRANARHYNFGEMGLVPELVSKKFFLASTPDGQELLSTIAAEMGEGWFAFSAPEEGEFIVSLPEQIDGPAIELYTAQLMPVALSRGEYWMATPVSEGEKYVLHIAGATQGSASEPAWRSGLKHR